MADETPPCSCGTSHVGEVDEYESEKVHHVRYPKECYVDEEIFVLDHVFDGERCEYCGVNMYDIEVYPGVPEKCPRTETINHTSQSEGFDSAESF